MQTQEFLNNYPVIKGNWKSHRNPLVYIAVYSLFGNLFSVEDITICELETIMGFFFSLWHYFHANLSPCHAHALLLYKILFLIFFFSFWYGIWPRNALGRFCEIHPTVLLLIPMLWLLDVSNIHYLPIWNNNDKKCCCSLELLTLFYFLFIQFKYKGSKVLSCIKFIENFSDICRYTYIVYDCKNSHYQYPHCKEGLYCDKIYLLI